METIFDHNPTEEELEMVPRVVCKDKKTYLQCVTDEDAVLRDLLALSPTSSVIFSIRRDRRAGSTRSARAPSPS